MFSYCCGKDLTETIVLTCDCLSQNHVQFKDSKTEVEEEKNPGLSDRFDSHGFQQREG